MKLDSPFPRYYCIGCGGPVRIGGMWCMKCYAKPSARVGGVAK